MEHFYILNMGPNYVILMCLYMLNKLSFWFYLWGLDFQLLKLEIGWQSWSWIGRWKMHWVWIGHHLSNIEEEYLVFVDTTKI